MRITSDFEMIVITSQRLCFYQVNLDLFTVITIHNGGTCCKFAISRYYDKKNLDGHSLSLLIQKDACSLHQIIPRVFLEIFGQTTKRRIFENFHYSKTMSNALVRKKLISSMRQPRSRANLYKSKFTSEEHSLETNVVCSKGYFRVTSVSHLMFVFTKSFLLYTKKNQ